MKVDGTTYNFLGRVPDVNGTVVTSARLTPTRTIVTSRVEDILQLNVTYLSPIEVSLSFDNASVREADKSISLTIWCFNLYLLLIWQSACPHWTGNRTMFLSTRMSAAVRATCLFYSSDLLPYQNGYRRTPSIKLSGTRRTKTHLRITPAVVKSLSPWRKIRASRKIVRCSLEWQLRCVRTSSIDLLLLIMQSPALSWRTNSDVNARVTFQDATDLGNSANLTYRPIQNPDDWPVFAIAYDLGTVTDESSEVAWGIGVARDRIAQAQTGFSPEEDRYPYYLSQYRSSSEAVSENDCHHPQMLILRSRCQFEDFLQSYDNASSRADDLDRKIMSAASNKSAGYADLIALGTRQVLAAFEVTISKGADGYNVSDIQAFMKDSGNSLYVSNFLRQCSCPLTST